MPYVAGSGTQKRIPGHSPRLAIDGQLREFAQVRKDYRPPCRCDFVAEYEDDEPQGNAWDWHGRPPDRFVELFARKLWRSVQAAKPAGKPHATCTAKQAPLRAYGDFLQGSVANHARCSKPEYEA